MARKKIIYTLATEPIDITVRNEDEFVIFIEERDEYGYSLKFSSAVSIQELYETLGDILKDHRENKQA